MASLSPKSLARLNTCDPRLVDIVLAAIKRFDFTVLCGTRSKEDQEDAFERGTTKLHYPHSRHNSMPSKAVDLAPYPIDWNNLARFKAMMQVVKEEAARLHVKVRFGNDFDRDGVIGNDRFIDWPHVELDE